MKMLRNKRKQKMLVYMSNFHFLIWFWHYWKDIECHDILLTYDNDVIVIDIFIWDHILEILLSHEYACWVSFSSLSSSQARASSETLGERFLDQCQGPIDGPELLYGKKKSVRPLSSWSLHTFSLLLPCTTAMARRFASENNLRPHDFSIKSRIYRAAERLWCLGGERWRNQWVRGGYS